MSDDKVKLLCSFGGNFTHHNESGKVFYMGGNTRLVCVERSISYPELLAKMVELSNYISTPPSIKFQFPGMSLDSPLVSVECDDDVHNMMDECGDGRLSVFLFPGQTILTPIPVREEATHQGVPSSVSHEDCDNTSIERDEATHQGVRSSVSNEDCGNTSIESAIREHPLAIQKDDAHCSYEDGGNASIVSSRREYSLEVGKEFPDAQSLRDALIEVAIAMNFELQMVKTDSRRLTAKCRAAGCPWRIHASKIADLKTFKIKILQPLHSCTLQKKNGLRQTNSKWIAGFIEKKFRDGADYKINDIIKAIQQEYGICIDYNKAYRGKELLMKEIHGSHGDSFRLLPTYCEQIRITNPGSIVCLDVGEDKAFQRLFLAFHASISGFVRGCRPLIGLGSMHTGAKYSDLLLLASSVDADGGMFPLASAVVESENDDNWIWFLSELKKLLPDDPGLTIISSTHKGLIDGIGKLFPNAFNSYCMWHLCEDMPKELKHTRIVKLFWRAASVVTPGDFYACMESIAELSPEALEWIRNTPPQLWATSHFKGRRYGYLTSSVSEYSHGWLDEAKDLLIIEMVEAMRVKMMKMFSERRENGLKWTSVLVPSAEAHILRSRSEARSHQITYSSQTEFEVGPAYHKQIVDIAKRTCTCCRWQVDGLPCSHAIAVLCSQNMNIYEYCENCFTIDSYRKAYSETIHHVPHKTQWTVVNNIEVKLPHTHRSSGRPRTLLIRRRKQKGHNKRTCKEVARIAGTKLR